MLDDCLFHSNSSKNISRTTLNRIFKTCNFYFKKRKYRILKTYFCCLEIIYEKLKNIKAQFNYSDELWIEERHFSSRM